MKSGNGGDQVALQQLLFSRLAVDHSGVWEEEVFQVCHVATHNGVIVSSALLTYGQEEKEEDPREMAHFPHDVQKYLK